MRKARSATSDHKIRLPAISGRRRKI